MHESRAIATRGVARAIRDMTLRGHEALTPKMRRAVVRSEDPLAVELMDAALVLDEDQLVLGSWVRLYDRLYGIAVGDTVYVVPFADGSWLLVEIAGDKDMVEGLELLSTARSLHTDHGHVVATTDYLDDDGNVVGVVLLYDPATLTASPD